MSTPTFTLIITPSNGGDVAQFDNMSMRDISITLEAQDPSTIESVVITESEETLRKAVRALRKEKYQRGMEMKKVSDG
jgi:hypothetical protein